MDIPVLSYENGRPVLLIDGQPTLMFGGEIHNSSSSSLEYMEEKVWPAVRGLHLNSLVVPVTWEFLEPEPGCFDFRLPDGLIAQARREKVRLVFLWFGLWKNGMSTYTPDWVKKDRETYFLMRDRNGCAVQAVSPLCIAGIERDAAAFTALMEHLRDTDKEHTVIMVQVENEMGLLGDCRDFSPVAETAYHTAIPEEMAAHYGASGDWHSAFGTDAPERFMVYYYAKAVERIASVGKEKYPLPMYVNAWLEQYPWTPGTYPCGGPIARMIEQWKFLAPSIDLYAPDIYLSDFEGVCRDFAVDGNPLFIPEARPCMDSASNVFVAVGELGALGFSPFAIEDVGIGTPDPLAPDLAQLNIMAEAFDVYRSGEYLSESYAMLQSIQPLLLEHRLTPSMHGFTCCERQMGTMLSFGQYDFQIAYLRHKKDSPKSGGLVIELAPDEFLFCGMNFSVTPLPKTDDPGVVNIISITEGCYQDGVWVAGRRLNGDEMRFRMGERPGMLRVCLARHPV